MTCSADRGASGHYRDRSRALGPLPTWHWLRWLDWSTGPRACGADRRVATNKPREFANATPQRPGSDWYETGDARKAGFQARSVVGGVFMRLLQDKARADKWRALAR